MIGMGPGTLAAPLGTVLFYCKRRKLPPLTVLVVNSKKGRPGRGFPEGGDQDQDRERVFGSPGSKSCGHASKTLSPHSSGGRLAARTGVRWLRFKRVTVSHADNSAERLIGLELTSATP